LNTVMHMRRWKKGLGLGVACALALVAGAGAAITTVSLSSSASTSTTGQPVTFTATATRIGVNTITYAWDFGNPSDTTGLNTATHATTATTDTATYTYNSAAPTQTQSYTVTVAANDGSGPASTTATEHIVDRVPVASFSPPSGAVATTPVSFVDTSSDPDGSIISRSWDFGDGSNSTQQSLTHTYAHAGNYTVQLTVHDNSGNQNSVTHAVAVADHPPVASFTAGPSGVLTQQPVSFDAGASSDPDGTVNGYSWNFGDGSPAATGATPSHVYAHSGQYSVTLTATDDFGLSATSTQVVSIGDRPPLATFSVNPGSAGAGDIIGFDASASSDPDGTVVQDYWFFGDGTSAVGAVQDHSYRAPGTYGVSLGVMDDSGTFDIATRVITVTASGLGFGPFAPEFFPPRLTLARVKVSHSGSVSFTVGCPASTGGCSGAVTLFTDPSSRSRSLKQEQRLSALPLNLPAGGSATLVLKIPSRVRSLLKRAHGSVHLYAVSADASGEYSLADLAVRVH
jgi:large repetitive protein